MNTALRIRLREAWQTARSFVRQRPFVPIAAASILALVTLVTVSRSFSVSCPPDTACISLAALTDGTRLPEATRIYDRDGVLLAETGGPLRRALPDDQIPELIADAFVAVEDRRFWDHDGVDKRGVLRAVVANLKEGGIAEGASTIPMQLVRTLWADRLRDAGPWRRKVIEARTAPQLVEELGRARVLALYLNSIYLGNGIYGIERASRHYFGVGAAELSLGQVATLVGITRSPEFYEPRRHPERAREVRDVVLRLLADHGVVSRDEAEQAMALELETIPLEDVEIPTHQRSHLTAAVLRLLDDLEPQIGNRTGLVVRTTIDVDIQRRGEEALRAQIAEIEAGRFGPYDGPVAPTAADAGDEGSDEDLPTFVEGQLEGAAVALDPTTSAIRAWIGGRDFEASEFDRVEQAQRQVGSLVKPFIVGLALESGIGIADLVSSDTIPIETDGTPWLPADHVLETSLPMREALIRSSNRAAAHLGMYLGLESLADVGRRVGLHDPIPVLPSSSIGAFDASLLEMTHAYTAFGSGGRLGEPYLVTRIETTDGEPLWAPAIREPEAVLDPGVAFVVLDAMRAVVDRGTGRSVRAWGYRDAAAGKTGTSNDGRDAWFVGLTPNLVAGVWIGFDTPRPIVEDRGGGALAAPVWATWMRSMQGEIPQRRAWIPPSNVERVRYDVVTGQVVSPHCKPPESLDGITWAEAWVVSGYYDRSFCPDQGGVRGWLGRLWRAVRPNDEPVRAIRVRPVGGG